MLALRLSRLRRLAGSLLLLCLGFLVAESVVADACDGDAAGARTPSAWAHEGAGAGAGGAVAAPADARGEAPAPTRHSTHVDHCVHPHAGGPIADPVLAQLPAQHAVDLRIERVLEPRSRSIDPPDRPPAF